jgi:acetoin utilization deacetylase AcuC-like enzyme
MLNRSLNRTRPRSFSLFLSIASFRQQMSTTPTIIQVIYDPEEKHRRHEPMTEFVLGHQMPHYHERPVRHENVLQHLREGMNQQSPGGLFKFIPSDKDYGFQPLLRIHSSGYLEYLQHVHSDWVRNEGNKDSGVMGDTFPVVRRPLYSTPVIDWPSNGRGDEGEDDLLSALIRRSLSAVSWGWSWWRWLRFGDLQLHRTSTAKLGLISQGGNPGYFSSDIDAPLMEGTWEAAYIASQLALRAADSLASEINSTSAKSNICATFAVCRPPGHHAHSELSGGFCYLNNAAIAAQYLIDNYKMRVLILDVDSKYFVAFVC